MRAILTVEEQTSLERLLEYVWRDEERDFQEQQEGREGHIFRDIVALNNLLHDTSDTPEDYLGEGV